MSKKAAPNKTFRLSALAAGIMAANSAWVIVPEAAAACAEESPGIYFCTGTSTQTISGSATDAIGVGPAIDDGPGGKLTLNVTSSGVIGGVVEIDGFSAPPTGFNATGSAAFAVDSENSVLNVTNAGVINASVTGATILASGTAIVLDGGGAVGTITNDGVITGFASGSSDATGVGVTAESGADVTITNNALISGGASGSGFDVLAAGVIIEGTASEMGSFPGNPASNFLDTEGPAATGNITNNGTISASASGSGGAFEIAGAGVEIGGTATVVNNAGAVISGAAFGSAEEIVGAGIFVSGETSFSITDRSSVSGATVGKYKESRSKGDATITNQGTISGAVSGSASSLTATGIGTRGTATISNEGLVVGSASGEFGRGQGVWIGQKETSKFKGVQPTSGPGTMSVYRVEDDLEGGGSATIVNSGTIHGSATGASVTFGAVFGTGIQVGGDADITNSSSGVISGSAGGGAPNAEAVGIEVVGAASYSSKFGTASSSSSMRAASSAPVKIDNAGTIVGSATNSSGGSFGDADGYGISVEGIANITNSGSVLGVGSGFSPDGIGIEVEDGSSFKSYASDGVEIIRQATEAAGDAVILNSGTIEGMGSTLGSASGSATGVGVLVGGTADITNESTGKIYGTATGGFASAVGVEVEDGGSFTETASSVVIYESSQSIGTATVNNSGDISAAAFGSVQAEAVGVEVDTGAVANITNSGTVEGYAAGGTEAAGLGVVHSGTAGMDNSNVGLQLTNSGKVQGVATSASSAFGEGVVVEGPGMHTVTNSTGGMISGSAKGSVVSEAIGVVGGGLGVASGTIVYSFAGSPTSTEVLTDVPAAAVTITNDGSISAAAGDSAVAASATASGIVAGSEVTVTNNSAGSITGTANGSAVRAAGIVVPGGGSDVYTETFFSSTETYNLNLTPGSLTLTNAGTVHGSAVGTGPATAAGVAVDGGTADINNSGNIKGDASGASAMAAGVAVSSFGDPATATVVNSSTGSIKGMAAGAAPLGAGVSVIGPDAAAIIENNGGMIVGSEVGVYVESSSTRVGLTSASAPVLDDPTNNGLAAVIINSGTISGMATTGASIQTGGGVTFISNSGMLKGDVLLGGADNIVDLTGGTVDGDVVHTGGFADIAFFGDATITGDVTDVNEVLFESGAGTIVGSVTGAELVDVFSGAVANFINGGTVGGVANAGRMNLTGTLTADSYADSLEDEDNPGVFTSGGQVFFMISSPTEAGQLVAGSVDLTSSTALGATPATGVELAEGAEFHVVDVTTVGGLSSTTPVEDLAVQGGGLYVFRAVLGDSTELTAGNGDADDIFFITDRVALTSLVSGGGDTTGGTTTTINESVVAAAAALEEVLASGTTDPILTAFVNEVLPLLDTEEIVTVLKEISQTSTVGSVGGAASAAAGGSGAAGGGAGAVGGTDVAMRLEELRLADSMAADSGINAGDHAMAARGFWIQAGNSKGEQDERDGVDGYDSISESLTLGLDAEVSSGNTAGLAYTYVRSDVSPDGNPGSIDMDTHALTLYGSTKRGIQSIDASFTYSDHAFDSTRGSTVLAGQAVADYDGSTLSLNLGTSWDNQLNKTFSLEPRIGLTWSQTEIDKYTETTTAGATIVPMAVEVDDIDALVARAGIALKAKFKDGPITWAPKLYATVHHDFEGEQPSARVGFAGALPRDSFGSKGAEPEKTLYEAGVGVTAYQTGKLKLTGKYAVSSQDDFDGQSLSFTARWKF